MAWSILSPRRWCAPGRLLDAAGILVASMGTSSEFCRLCSCRRRWMLEVGLVVDSILV